MKKFGVLLIGISFAVACNEKEAEPLPAAESSAAPEPTPEPSAAEADEDDGPSEEILEQIPTPEDFEEEAREDITAENMEEELDRLEEEIGG